MTESNIIEGVLNKSDGVLILFFILIAAALIPFYRLIIKDRNERFEQENKRQEKYIELNNLMIKALNEVTCAVAKLDTLIEINTNDTKTSLERIHVRIDKIFDYINNIYFYINGAEANQVFSEEQK